MTPLAHAHDSREFGGKAAGLAAALAAGLRVPDGFVLPAAAFRRDCGRVSETTSAKLVAAYAALGRGPVAVRSSATSEDGAADSFAGQQDTFLNVVGDTELIAAVQKCWDSLSTERAIAYRREKGLSTDAATAVVIQRMVPATAAGVLFTTDPLDATAETLRIEAAAGLGDAVVSGRVSPDRYRLRRTTGETIESVGPCLSSTQLRELYRLSQRVETAFGGPRDVEFAFVNDDLFLLQARPVTATAADTLALRRAEVAAVRAQPGTVWVKFNLSESLPAPTPLTWGVIQRLVAPDGGMGAMIRDLGGEPDPTLGSRGGFDLIAGRVMANLNRLPRLQSARPVAQYPLDEYRKTPALAADPKPVLKPLAHGLFKLPGILRAAAKQTAAARAQLADFPRKFRTEIAPPFEAAARAQLAADWAQYSPPRLAQLFAEWTERTLVQFARDALKPTVFAEMLLAGGPMAGPAPDPETDFAAGLRTLPRPEFLAKFGHRGPGELELANPRWSESPPAEDPLTLTLSPAAGERGPVAEMLRLREAAKHYLLLGYAILRRAAVELDGRLGLNGGVFYLTPDELPLAAAGRDFRGEIAARRKKRKLLLSLPLPPVLFAEDAEAIGRPLPPPVGADLIRGVAVSPGVAEGPAVILLEPAAVPGPDGFILVCPSTDPGWVPLFARAAAVVLETGGVLSHGAIVAREFGLPAVAGVPDATRRFRPGQLLRVDGSAGTVAASTIPQ